MIHPLEPRRLLSATYDGTTEILSFDATSGGDTIVLNVVKNELDISVNGTVNKFNAAKVSSIHVDAGAGPDKITATLKIPLVIHGGKGDDTITGGEGNDILFGDGGSNNISGGSGDDTIHAGLQADTLNGDKGNDTFIPDNKTPEDEIIGGSGFDFVDYENSSAAVVIDVSTATKPGKVTDLLHSDIEFVRGSSFNDSISNSSGQGMKMYGGPGNDTLIGGKDDDTIDGGTGIDSILGNGGGDHLRTKDGQIDIVDGGSGKDILENFDRSGTIDSISNIP
jgi:Ca2+-binding RTX toxin-like protein